MSIFSILIAFHFKRIFIDPILELSILVFHKKYYIYSTDKKKATKLKTSFSPYLIAGFRSSYLMKLSLQTRASPVVGEYLSYRDTIYIKQQITKYIFMKTKRLLERGKIRNEFSYFYLPLVTCIILVVY